MKLWKRAVFWAFGWTARAVASLWLSTCRISEFGREIEENYLEQNPDKGLFRPHFSGTLYAIAVVTASIVRLYCLFNGELHEH